ncbi:hypothetical protein IQ06DRAFT_34950 [Phaeosphaeriaceae sp. SRC1lsM3a]|nr:hypothetical protein IQ06DRAFT_34950 [Stagonospora sp. SRC1lsM3a]
MLANRPLYALYIVGLNEMSCLHAWLQVALPVNLVSSHRNDSSAARKPLVRQPKPFVLPSPFPLSLCLCVWWCLRKRLGTFLPPMRDACTAAADKVYRF